MLLDGGDGRLLAGLAHLGPPSTHWRTTTRRSSQGHSVFARRKLARHFAAKTRRERKRETDREGRTEPSDRGQPSPDGLFPFAFSPLSRFRGKKLNGPEGVPAAAGRLLSQRERGEGLRSEKGAYE